MQRFILCKMLFSYETTTTEERLTRTGNILRSTSSWMEHVPRLPRLLTLTWKVRKPCIVSRGSVTKRQPQKQRFVEKWGICLSQKLISVRFMRTVIKVIVCFGNWQWLDSEAVRMETPAHVPTRFCWKHRDGGKVTTDWLSCMFEPQPDPEKWIPGCLSLFLWDCHWLSAGPRFNSSHDINCSLCSWYVLYYR